MVDFCVYARSVLYNGLGRYDAARDAARRAFELHPIGYGPLVVSELAEAAARTGDAGLAQAALESASGRARATPTAVGAGPRGPGPRPAERAERPRTNCYQESISHLGRTRMRSELARGAPAVRGVAAPREPAGRRARAAAHRPRHAGRDGHGGVRRTGPPRAGRHRRDGPQAGPRDQQHAHRAGKLQSPGWPATAGPTRKSVPSCSCPRARSNGTCARSSPSSASPPGASSTACCPQGPDTAGPR